MKNSRPRWIYGRHTVEETLRSKKGGALELCASRDLEDRLREVVSLAKSQGIAVRWVDKPELDRLCGNSRHQGLALKIAQIQEGSFEDFLAELSSRSVEKGGGGSRDVLVALDQIQDPHNFGAIARSAACFGARALITPERRSAPISQAVLSSSAGAVQKIPVFQVVNLARALTRLKESGVWVYGADASGKSVWQSRLNRPLVLVIGSEGEGLRPLVKSQCDELVAIPQSPGGVASINASCAASVLLYEIARQAAASRS